MPHRKKIDTACLLIGSAVLTLALGFIPSQSNVDFIRVLFTENEVVF